MEQTETAKEIAQETPPTQIFAFSSNEPQYTARLPACQFIMPDKLIQSVRKIFRRLLVSTD